jgi:RNA polymerase sporulation-specific sigma factor
MARNLTLEPLSTLDDEQLASLAQQGDGQALEVLVQRYRRFARAKARTYFLVGGDSDDIEQEGLIGLFKAARDYRGDREASFRGFAELCVTRQVISAIKAATRQKHQPLNRYVSTSAVVYTGDAAERSVDDLLASHAVADPVEEVISREQVAGMRQVMADTLSRLEVEVLGLYVEGKSYVEIGEELGRHVKSIDNALQRIKRKLDQRLNLDEHEDDRELALVS